MLLVTRLPQDSSELTTIETFSFYSFTVHFFWYLGSMFVWHTVHAISATFSLTYLETKQRIFQCCMISIITILCVFCSWICWWDCRRRPGSRTPTTVTSEWIGDCRDRLSADNYRVFQKSVPTRKFESPSIARDLPRLSAWYAGASTPINIAANDTSLK